MTPEEFKTWFAHHRACFPGIDSWLGKIDATAKNRSENPLTSTDVLKRWRESLNDIALADAKEASSRMLKGDAEPPKMFDNHPRAIRKLAFAVRGDKRQAPKTSHWHDGEPTQCARCRDSGGITVVHDKTLAAIRAGKEVLLGRATMVVRCHCTAGTQKIPSVRLVSDDDVPCDWNLYDPQEWDRVLNAVSAPVAWTPDESYESLTGGNGGF